MKSPYFQKRARSEIPTEQRSCYFRKSPVSCYGTIERLGPLIFVLSNEDYPCGNSSCQNTPQCSACSTVINDAISHFYMCETFRISYESVLSEIRRWKVSDRLTCWEEADTAIQRSVRHLCPCRCYLRAFAPFREWLSLRRHLHALVDSPLGMYVEKDLILIRSSVILFTQSLRIPFLPSLFKRYFVSRLEMQVRLQCWECQSFHRGDGCK